MAIEVVIIIPNVSRLLTRVSGLTFSHYYPAQKIPVRFAGHISHRHKTLMNPAYLISHDGWVLSVDVLCQVIDLVLID